MRLKFTSGTIARAPRYNDAGWFLIKGSQPELAEASGLGTIGHVRSSADNVAAVCRALESTGVEYTSGDAPGVRIRKG